MDLVLVNDMFCCGRDCMYFHGSRIKSFWLYLFICMCMCKHVGTCGCQRTISGTLLTHFPALKTLFYLLLTVYMCELVPMSANALWGQDHWFLLKLELQEVSSHLVLVLGLELGSSGRAVHAINFWVFSFNPFDPIFDRVFLWTVY